MMLAMPKSSTSSVTHPLLSARRSHQRSRPIDEVDESPSASTAVEDGVHIGYGKCCIFRGSFVECRLMGTSQLTRTTQERIKISWDAGHRAVATKE
ncbi:hypothetical protein DVH24_025876 [Malus domestica]|uniref:Uncharacterized protein n=1 Tax=Malus domestica TaxID=3750 RepID=A0A498KEE8_MALDO|nr:hypothetical protein DVH24_025876 [Malus domestica]